MPQQTRSPQGGDLALVGRSAELAALSSFLRRMSAGGAALVLTGEPGVGKSALLEAVAREAAASGTTVLRAAGVEFEAGMDFAGLHQLLLPLLGDVPALPGPHRDVLAVALGLSTGPPPPALLVSAATLGLLRHTATGCPVLVQVDDLPWLDTASAAALGFVARRLQGSRIGVVGAAPTGSRCLLLQAGLPELEVPPLDEPSAAELLDRGFPTSTGLLRQRVMAAAAGNPRALLELPAVVTAEQRAGAVALPRRLPLSTALRRDQAERLARLPATTRDLLLLVALDVTGDLGTLRAAAGDDDWLDGLGPAERDRLVLVDVARNHVSFRHPLIGAAVVELATSSEGRRAHRALAAALVDHPERCAWHLGQSAVGPDTAAADLLETSSHRARAKGDAPRSVRSLLQAAHLTPAGPDRARRLAEAAFVGADTTGYLRTVPPLLSEASAADPSAGGSLRVATAAAHHLLHADGDVDTASLVLLRALHHPGSDRPDARTLEDALHCLLLACHVAGREELWGEFERALDRVGAGASDVLAVSATVFADPARATPEALDRLDELVSAVQGGSDPAHVVRVATAARWSDRLAGCRQALRRVVADGRAGGAVASALQALVLLAHDAQREGRWDEAARTAQEATAWSERLGYRLLAVSAVHCEGLVAAARGDEATAAACADRLEAWSASRGTRLLGQYADHVRGLQALGRGEFEEAYWHLAAVNAPGDLRPHAPVALEVAMDVVEAAVRTGRRSEAERHVAAVQRSTVFRSRPWPAVVASASAAVVASGEEATGLFEAALATPGAHRHPFEEARTRLAYGEHLRRSRATTAARLQLTSAAEAFRRLGATPWAARAATELAATGWTAGPAPAGDRRWALTSQEYQIAMLAASGLSNKQIGSRMFLSPRTVGAHLYRVFPKLGISSRAALRDALSAARDGVPAGAGVPSRAG
ncbi:AAA family ATPase [Geodermatophilus sp. URMC 63]